MSALTITGFLLALGISYQLLRSRRRVKLPPGPKPHFIIGNALDIPLDRTWETFTAWKQTYGDVIYLEVLGKSMIILNTHQACLDLLEKRSAIYSGRPRFVMLFELMQWDWLFSGFTYSSRWRVYRRLFHKFFDENASKRYVHLQEKHVHSFLRRTLREPEKFWENTRLSFTETVLDVVYGVKDNSKLTRLLHDAMENFNVAGVPGKYLVDIFPIFKYIPTWMPGARFHKDAAAGRIFAQQVREVPANLVKENMKNGTGGSSILASILESCEEKPLDTSGVTPESSEDIAKNVAGVTFIAAADTTLLSVYAFFLAVANYPDVQKEAQAELDKVTGSSRLPTANDMEDLPYIRAIIKEIMRWHSPLPLGVVHSSSEDDEYRGYFIPKGSIIFPNVWGILHDPNIYPDPHSFNPSRWLIETDKGRALRKDLPDSEPAFGFGRRICPGRFFAQNTLFLVISSVLACFNISPLSADGKPVEKIEDCVDTTQAGVFNIIKQFNLSITPRSEKVAQIIAELE